MTVRKTAKIVFFLLACAWASHSYGAQVRYIPPREYFHIVQNAIQKAKSCIHVCMYSFVLYPQHPDSLTFQMAEALIEARKRGVSVQVILDQNIHFADGVPERVWAVQGKNQYAYDYLKRNNVNVMFDSATTYMHAKCIVIDKETIVLGSSNWTQAAFHDNYEANVFIRSADMAQKILKGFQSIKTQPESEKVSVVYIPYAFMTNPRLMGRMITRNDQRAFDVYLYLIRESAVKNNANFRLDFHALAVQLGISHMSRTGYRRQIIKVLRKLKNNYKLIDFSKEYAKDYAIRLMDLEAPDQELKPETNRMPMQYWTFGWNRELGFAGKVFYLIDQHHSLLSAKGNWCLSGESLKNLYHCSKWFIHKGVTELKRANLLEVQYGELPKNPTSSRKPNVYYSNLLYDPKALHHRFSKLKKKHGKEKYQRAKQWAALVYEDSNIDAVEKFIRLEDKYSLVRIQKAAKIIKDKNPDNPKRNLGYFYRTIERIDLDP